MKRSWIISLALSFVMIIGGVFALTYIKDIVPDQIQAEPVLSQPVNDEDNQKQVPKKTKDIIYESQKLVVQIELSDGTIGSGFLYNNRGDVVTNAHVVANHKDVTVMTTESKEMPGEVIGVSRNTDVAVVRVPGLKGGHHFRFGQKEM